MSRPAYSFFRYALPRHDGVEPRRGFLVRCTMDGASGWGDIAPLDGYSRETFADAAREIHRAESSTLASIRSGLEFAEAECRAKLAGKTMVDYFGGSVRNVEIARLLVSDETGGERPLPKKGTIKIKVGRKHIRDDVERVKSIMAKHPEARFRFDANRAWCLDDALIFCRAVDSSRVDFVEEPLADVSDYDAFDAATPVGFALDESLMGLTPRGWANLKSLVIKPSLLGGIATSVRLIDWAYASGRYAVISAMYESGVGICHLAALAAAKTPGVAAGLDTYSVLADDVVTPRLEMDAGVLSVDVLRNIDMSKLEPLS